LSARRAGALAGVFAALLAIVWRAGAWIAPGALGAANAALGLLVAVVVIATWRHDGVTLASLGLAPSRWRAGWPSALAFTAAGVLLLAGLGLALGSASLAEARFAWIADYAPGLVAQQLLLQGFFVPGLLALAGGRRIAAGTIAAAAFAALHAPNAALMAGVAAAAAFWIPHFLAHRNLLAVAASHLALGTAAMAALGPGPMLNLRVGAGALDLWLR
jgi:hypothetical protein